MTEDRFDRLFADLDAAHAGAEQHERMGEYGDLVAGELAQTTLCLLYTSDAADE